MGRFSKGSVTRYKLRPTNLAAAWYVIVVALVILNCIVSDYYTAYWLLVTGVWVAAWNWEHRTVELVRQLAKSNVREDQVSAIRVTRK